MEPLLAATGWRPRPRPWGRLGLVASALVAGLSIGGCRGDAAEDRSSGDRVTIVCTVGMVADVVARVAGEGAEVVTLVRPGVDPHLHKPTRSDLSRLRNADLIFSNGHHLEGRMEEALDRAAASGTPVVPVAERIDEVWLLDAAEYEGVRDPHVWMDPKAWSGIIEVVEAALAAHDPDRAEAFRANAEALRGEFEGLQAYAERVLASVPAEQRVLITSHDAFQYFGRRFDCEVLGIQGISTESEAGVGDIERLVDVIVERGVPAVFVESTVGRRHVEAIIAGARARGHEVVVGGELFSDAMGEEGTYPGTYVGMIDHNVTTVARALGGEAPAGGMAGRLVGSEQAPTP